MVKNTTGGGRTKGLARKHQRSTNSGSSFLRVPECEEEEIALVTKMYGNGMCEIYTNNNVKLIGHIRNKFRGRQKRHNKIEPGNLVLIGLREWESVKKNCDILTIYDENDVNQLKIKPDIKIDHLIRLKNANSIISTEETGDFEFVEEEQEEELINELKNPETTFIIAENETIDMDDI